jgi:SAM-dependent methyltransferase
MKICRFVLALGLALVIGLSALAQDKSVRPGINKPFENPNVGEYVGKFEVESREIYAKRKEIVAACKLKPGMAVADVGAGTGLFTRLFATEVGPEGKIFAVDIAPKFIDHIAKTCKEAGLKNVQGIVCTPTSAELPENSVDLVFICDTYHHFEFPYKTLASIHRALRPGGQLVLIDFHRIEGKSSDWVLGHVRAGQEVFVNEIVTSGFKQVGEEKILKENYFVRFEKKPAAEETSSVKGTISWNGKPVAKGRIFFHLDKDQFVGAKIKDGSYAMDRVPVGEWTITIESEGIPASYSAEDKSPLRIKVNKGNQNINVELMN